MPVLTPLRWAVLTYPGAHSGLRAQSSAAPRWPRGWRGWEDHCDSGRESGGGFAAPPPRHTYTGPTIGPRRWRRCEARG